MLHVDSILLKFPLTTTTRPVGPVVHYNKRWDIAAANHVAHGNAIRGRAPEEQYACGSNASRVVDMADEIVCFSLNPNRNAHGSLDVLVAGQLLTDLNAPGGGGDYEKMPKGNLDVTGRYFIWTTNLGGGRLDAVLLKVSADLLAIGQTPSSSSHVGDLDRSASSLGGGLWRGTAAIQIHSAAHGAVPGAVVSGPGDGGFSGTASCTTDGNGRCSVLTGSVRNGAQTATFSVMRSSSPESSR